MVAFFFRLYHKKISPKGLSVFRILFCTVLFFEVLHIFRYRALYFDPIPFLETANIDFTYLLLGWMFVLLFLICGFFTRIATVLNYLLAVFILNNLGSFEYHMDYAYLGISFLMIFMPLAKTYAIDAFYKSYKVKNKFDKGLDSYKVSVLYYYLPVLVGIGFVYLGSIPFKLKSDLWLGGLGVWLPASLPQITILNDQWFLNQKLLIYFMGYFTLCFEFLFPFIFFLKRLRWPIVFSGLVLHIGILLEFPIPYFALGVIALYALIVPVAFWDKLETIICRLLKKEKKKLTNKLEPIKVVHRDRIYKLKGHGLFILLFIFILLQYNVMFNFPVSDGLEKHISTDQQVLKSAFDEVKKLKKKIAIFSTRYFGITAHGVFIDSHFEGFTRIYTLKYNDEFLPFYDRFGMPEAYLRGGSWINFNYRVNKPHNNIENELLRNGLMRYSSFWSHKNNISLKEASFEIVSKKINVPFYWEENLLLKNRMEPWRQEGMLFWKDNTSTFIENKTER